MYIIPNNVVKSEYPLAWDDLPTSYKNDPSLWFEMDFFTEITPKAEIPVGGLIAHTEEDSLINFLVLGWRDKNGRYYVRDKKAQYVAIYL